MIFDVIVVTVLGNKATSQRSLSTRSREEMGEMAELNNGQFEGGK